MAIVLLHRFSKTDPIVPSRDRQSRNVTHRVDTDWAEWFEMRAIPIDTGLLLFVRSNKGHVVRDTRSTNNMPGSKSPILVGHAPWF